MATNDNTQLIPIISGSIDQSFLIEPLGGPAHPTSYLDRFPDELYNKAPESHFVRFIYALLGPAGIGWLRKNYLEARLALEDLGVNLTDLDLFYGDPFKFGRIAEEQFTNDPSGLLTKDQWQEIQTKDTQYRNRVIDFLAGARMGNSPGGMHLIARSGLGYENEIFENYRYLYDVHSDNPVGIPYMGHTTSTEEMIIMPRAEVPRSMQQTVLITGSPTGGTFSLIFNGYQTNSIAYNALASNANPHISGSIYRDVQAALENIPIIGVGQVHVTGGPGPANAFIIEFTGNLSNTSVSQFKAINSLTGDPTATIDISTNVSAIESNDTPIQITAIDKYNLYAALSRIKPVTTIPTLTDGPGTTFRQQWLSVNSTSQYIEVVRYVTGQPGINWKQDRAHWIEKGIEREAPRIADNLQHHYQGFHNIATISPYTNEALADSNYLLSGPLINFKSEHIGRFSPAQIVAMPFMSKYTDDHFVFNGGFASAVYPEPLVVATQMDDATGKSISLINGIYPTDYASQSGVNEIQYRDPHFWSSKERASGDEYLEIDLGEVQAVNFIGFEITTKPIDIEIAYDLLDQSPARIFKPVTPLSGVPYPNSIIFTPEEQSPWYYVEFSFTNSRKNIIFTRYIRIKFARRINATNPFLYDPINKVQNPWSIEVRNLRLGRNVSDPF